MRKLLILIVISLMFLVSGCNTSINSSVYISSIGFDVKDDKLVAYFLSNPLTDISRSSEDKKTEAQYIQVETSSVYEAFMMAEESLLLPLNFLHVKTVIFTEECLNSKYVLDFLVFIKSVRFISYNFYVFSTMSKIEEIYKFKNPEQVSFQYSLISSPDLLDYKEYGIEKLHFLDFANDYYNKNRYLHIPLVNVNEVWNENVTLKVEGFICLDSKTSVYMNSIFKGMLYLYDRNSLLFYDGINVYRITNYRVNNYEKNGKFVFSILYEDVSVFGDGSKKEFEEKLVLEIKKYLDAYASNQNGLYLIEFYNYLNTKNLDVFNYEIEILHKG